MDLYSNENINEVVQNIRDMFYPMEDLEDAIDYIHEDDELQLNTDDEILKKKINVECETIKTSLLDYIILIWKKSTDENKDILKEYYNKFQKLIFEDEYHISPFHMDLIHNLNDSVETTDNLKQITVGMIYSLEEIHKLLKNYKLEVGDIMPWGFRAPLKKLESCIISIIFILKMNTDINYELYVLECLHSSLSN